LEEKKIIRHSGWLRKFGGTQNRLLCAAIDVMTAGLILGLYVATL